MHITTTTSEARSTFADQLVKSGNGFLDEPTARAQTTATHNGRPSALSFAARGTGMEVQLMKGKHKSRNPNATFGHGSFRPDPGPRGSPAGTLVLFAALQAGIASAKMSCLAGMSLSAASGLLRRPEASERLGGSW